MKNGNKNSKDDFDKVYRQSFCRIKFAFVLEDSTGSDYNCCIAILLGSRYNDTTMHTVILNFKKIYSWKKNFKLIHLKGGSLAM